MNQAKYASVMRQIPLILQVFTSSPLLPPAATCFESGLYLQGEPQRVLFAVAHVVGLGELLYCQLFPLCGYRLLLVTVCFMVKVFILDCYLRH